MLASVLCISHARRVQKSSLDEPSAPDALAELLLALPRVSVGNPTQSLPFARSRLQNSPDGLSSKASVGIGAQQGATRSSQVDMMAGLPAGANVVVYGSGAMSFLAARIAAIQGFNTSLAVISEQDFNDAEELCFDSSFAKGSIPLAVVPIAGELADENTVNAIVANADALIVAFDGQEQIMTSKALNVLMSPSSGVKHISLLSRSLNGEGMGVVVGAARVGSNADVWTANEENVKLHSEMESIVKARAAECGATYTIIRVGTLKGGSTGGTGDGGEPSFLNTAFYDKGIQDIVNWRLIFDNTGLDFKLLKGDTLVGPGIRAIWDARDKVGEGDSHRGAAAAALVEALRTPAAHNADFSVKTLAGRKFPSHEQIASLFENAA